MRDSGKMVEEAGAVFRGNVDSRADGCPLLAGAWVMQSQHMAGSDPYRERVLTMALEGLIWDCGSYPLASMRGAVGGERQCSERTC